MATTEDFKDRIRVLTEQLCSELGDISVSEEQCWLTAVEDMAAEVGDVVATTLVEKQSVAQAKKREADCPQCGKPGHYQGIREREFITRRGPAMIAEPQYHCPCCRKAFFPDDASNWR